MKRVLVIDAQGGGIGRQVVAEIAKRELPLEVIAIGASATATAAMMKAGASKGATGENPIVVCSRDADYIIGPIGILSADSMLGEITPKMAVAIGQSRARKILIPVNNCGNYVAGVSDKGLKAYIEEAVGILVEQCGQGTVCR